MALQGWQRQYLAALLTSNTSKIDEYESVEFFSSLVTEPVNGVVELLLHRLIMRLKTIRAALQLLEILRTMQWDNYAPRILARIADTEAVLAQRPELAEYFHELRHRTGYTTYSIKDWRLLSDGTNLAFPKAPVWTNRMTAIDEILPKFSGQNLRVDDVGSVLEHFYETNVRAFQIALLTTSGKNEKWATALHKILAVPYIALDTAPAKNFDKFTERSPADYWSPHWQISMQPNTEQHWDIYEAHTARRLHGIGSNTIFDQISILLALTGLLREGINLAPIDSGLVRALIPSHPIWGFRRREFSAARTTYQAEDIRALALGFLEALPATSRVSMFRSRLALDLIAKTWKIRKSASVVTAQNGFYSHLTRAVQLIDENRFEDVHSFIRDSPFESEPVFQFLHHEAAAALQLFEILEELPAHVPEANDLETEEILCVTHASVPDQTGGYAIRAHGILRSLKEHGVHVSAVTRPGFPSGVLTGKTIEVVDDVEYARLPATEITRSHGEMQYMMSFIKPFKRFFQHKRIGIVHVRSTFLIALPALIAARQLGLKVLYEVSGLWELVYQDRETHSHLLKRSPFAELAETLTMTRADQVVVMNEAVYNIAVDRGVSPDRLHIARNAVNTENFTPTDPPNNSQFTLGYLGSFADYEGLDNIIDVVHELRKQEFPIHVLMVGDGLRFNHIRSRVINEGLENYFTLTGRVAHEEVKRQYQQMDVLVYPRISTGATQTITPLKPFEALALAKPIIVSDVEPLREIVGDSERGLVFENGNVQDFAQAIKKCSSAPELMSSLGQAGRQWVVENRNWEKVVETFLDAYSALT